MELHPLRKGEFQQLNEHGFDRFAFKRLMPANKERVAPLHALKLPPRRRKEAPHDFGGGI
jgi:hypothetical protein